MEERMKALQDRQEKNRFTQLSHIEISSALEQGVVCTMEIFPECTNHLGFVHAGALYTLAENAAGAAAFHFDGRRYVTQGGNIHYLGNQKSGVLRAEARVVHRGNSTALVRTKVTGENGKLICTGEFSFFCIDR